MQLKNIQSGQHFITIKYIKDTSTSHDPDVFAITGIALDFVEPSAPLLIKYNGKTYSFDENGTFTLERANKIMSSDVKIVLTLP